MKSICLVVAILFVYANNAWTQPTLTTERTVPVGRLQVHVEESGHGDALIFVHAGCLDGRMWDKQVSFFSKFYRVVVFDQPGHGQTLGVDTTLLIADVIKTIMDSLGIRSASFTGLSIGSASVLDFVLAYPDRVNKIVLVSPGISGWNEVFKADSLSNKILMKMQTILDSKSNERLAQGFTDTWCVGPFRSKDSVDAGAREYVYQTALNRLNKHAVTDWPVLNENTQAKRLGSIQNAVLIIAGDKDVPLILTNATYIFHHIAKSRLEIIPDVAHMLNLENPLAFNNSVRDFLRD
jgi:pimeloyl-ACP methyl ester carboxylesterase